MGLVRKRAKDGREGARRAGKGSFSRKQWQTHLEIVHLLRSHSLQPGILPLGSRPKRFHLQNSLPASLGCSAGEAAIEAALNAAKQASVRQEVITEGEEVARKLIAAAALAEACQSKREVQARKQQGKQSSTQLAGGDQAGLAGCAVKTNQG